MANTLLEIVDAQFGFCHERIPGKGEDSWCYSLNERACLLGVFDGCGGLGAATYEKLGSHTGAFLASRASAAGAMAWFDAYCDGGLRDSQALKRHLQSALSVCVDTADAPPSALKGSMVRLMPTTLALWLVEREAKGLTATSYSAGDSRTYLLDALGLAQVSVDDIANEDAMSNLYHDAAMTNVVSADGHYTIAAARHRLSVPCVLISATDGCFGYFRSPMEFEYLLLDTLHRSNSIDGWSDALEAIIGETAGDDQTLAAVVIGYGSHEQLKRAMLPRWRALEAMVASFGDSFDARQAAWEQYSSAYYRLAKGRGASGD